MPERGFRFFLPGLALLWLGGWISLAGDPPPDVAQPGAGRAAYLRKHVEFLTNTQGPRNHENLPALNRSAEYIAEKMRETGAAVRFQEFPVKGQAYKNVIAEFPGKAPARLIIGAHYDVAGQGPGADDNASGVAVLLELAFLIKERGLDLPHQVELVAYSLEEPPYFRTESMGSYIHAKNLSEAKTPVALMIALDCVGYFTDRPGSQNFPAPGMALFYPEKGNFLAVAGKTGQGDMVDEVSKFMARRMKLPVETITAPAFLTGIDFSDHLNYWKFDFPAVLVSDTAFYRNRNYHRPGDTSDTLNYAGMAEVVEGLYGVLIDWRE